MDSTANSHRLMQQLDQIGEVSNSEIQIEIADANKHHSHSLKDPDSIQSKKPTASFADPTKTPPRLKS